LSVTKAPVPLELRLRYDDFFRRRNKVVRLVPLPSCDESAKRGQSCDDFWFLKMFKTFCDELATTSVAGKTHARSPTFSEERRQGGDESAIEMRRSQPQ
jgi:hypothetical protein